MNPAVKVILASGYLDPDIKTSLQLAGQSFRRQAVRPFHCFGTHQEDSF